MEINKTVYDLSKVKENLSSAPPMLTSKNGFVGWGLDNLYPNELVDMFLRSSTHGTICKNKQNNIVGNGLIIEENHRPTAKFIQNVNSLGESLEDVCRKIALDLVIFDAYAILCVYNKKKNYISELYHVPYNNVRWGKKVNGLYVPNYYVSENWAVQMTGQPVQAFNTNKVDEYNQLLIYSNQTPYLHSNLNRQFSDYYCVPSYNSAKNYIEAAVKISEFYNNLISNGFFPGLHIDMVIESKLSPDEMDQIDKQLQAQYKGVKNAGSYILTVSRDENKRVEINPIQLDDLDKKFTELNSLIEQQIRISHGITSPMILGIETSGKLGGRQELIESWEVYMNKTINPMQNVILSKINKILEFNGFKSVKFLNESPIQFMFGESILKDILTKNELRNLCGYEDIEGGDTINGVQAQTTNQ